MKNGFFYPYLKGNLYFIFHIISLAPQGGGPHGATSHSHTSYCIVQQTVVIAHGWCHTVVVVVFRTVLTYYYEACIMPLARFEKGHRLTTDGYCVRPYPKLVIIDVGCDVGRK